MTDCIRIAMWSGPRNLSTAMMRSFGSRADSFVTDEPFYGAYLRQTGDPQPMMEQVMASMDCDWYSVARTLSGPNPAATPIWYQKHMAHHMVGPIAHHDLPGLRHAFLIRDPARVVASYAAKRVMVRPDHLGTCLLYTSRCVYETGRSACDRGPLMQSARYGSSCAPSVLLATNSNGRCRSIATSSLSFASRID